MSRPGLGAFGVEATPERPGPGPMPDALLRALELTIGRRIDGLLAGDHRSSLLGMGSELAQIRAYQPGDDVRRIDWNVTARTGIPHVRVHLAERVLVTWLVLDGSASMAFGTADRRKADVAAGVAFALGHAASARGNRIGLVSFGGHGSVTMPPKQGRVGLVGLMLTLRDAGFARGLPIADLAAALRRVGSIARQRALIVVVSDFRGLRNWQPSLLEIAGRHDVLAIEVRDPREQELPDIGEVAFVDPETGRQLRVDTRNRRLRERFAAAAMAERGEVARMISAAGAGHKILSTEGDWLRSLATYLKQRLR